MAQKTLTAKVRLVTTDAEKALDRLTKKIQTLESKINKISNNNNLEKQLNKQATATEKVNRKLTSVTDKVKKWASGQKQINSLTSGTNNILGSVASKLRRIASIYFGIMGAKYAINATDTITKAENKLNYLSAGQLGDSGYNADGGYSDRTLAMTQDAVDKMYASSQKVRMGYGAMMSNVSKMMTLAPDAFQGNTDAAIRFQEIMAESYALGGASADEMSTSMYQLTQALGAGTLAGDELRSVREGAPLAYKAIEEFAQGIYKTDESLKDLAADGKISSDMVVAAIMEMGTKADKAFAQTTQTFEQTWEQIKNAALYAFDPVGDKLREVLTKAVDNGLIQKIETAFAVVANTILWILEKIEISVAWLADNWNWLKHVVVGALILITAYLLVLMGIQAVQAAKAIIAWTLQYGWILVLIAGILALLYVFYLFASGSISLSEAIVYALLIIGATILLVGILLGNIPMIIAGVIVIVIGLVVKYLEYIVGALYSVAAFAWNIVVGCANSILQFLWTGFVEPWIGIIEWVLNVFNGGFDSFLDGVINLISNIISWFLALGKIVTTIIDAIFGFNWTGALTSLQEKVLQWGKNENSITLSREAPTVQSLSGGKVDRWAYSDAWDTGMSHGTIAKTFINGALDGVGSSIQDKFKGFSLDGLTDKLGFNIKFPNVSDPSYNIADAYQRPDDSELLGNIDDNTKLTADDLKYLRDIANMEWKKEFTTAEIHVEMNNTNTVNGDSDLDGLVTKLTTKLYEELDTVANGVYA